MPSPVLSLNAHFTYKRLQIRKVKGIAFEDGRVFEKVQYANLTDGAGLAALSQWYLFEKIYDGKIKMYRRFRTIEEGEHARDYPGDQMYWGQSTWCSENFYELIIVNFDGKLRSIDAISIKKMFEEYKPILTKYENDGYPNLRPKFNTLLRNGNEFHPEYLEGFRLLLQDFEAL